MVSSAEVELFLEISVGIKPGRRPKSVGPNSKTNE